MKTKITLSIQEIVNDFYSLAEEEGYLTGLADANYINDKDKESYHNNMVDLINKYLPSWEKNVDEKYWDKETQIDEKGVILSSILCENFKDIFYQLV